MADKDKIFDEQNLKDFWQILLNKLEPKEDGKHLSTNDLTDELKNAILSFNDDLRSAVANIYTIKEPIIFEELPEDARVGDVYNIGNGFTADDRFVESERGNLYGTGANVVYTEDGWDVLSGYATFIHDVLHKPDVVPISDDSIIDICRIPEYHCTIGIITDKTEMAYVDRSLSDVIDFDTCINDIKYIYITAIANNGISTQNIYYYISTAPISPSEVSTITWTKYNGQFDINDMGRYIIYAKVINQLGEIKYACTNGFILDFIKPIASITVGKKTSSNTPLVFDDINYIYNYNESQQVSINAFDEHSEIESIYYFISGNSGQSLFNLEDIEYLNWIPYKSPFTIDDTDKYAIYAKVVDKANNILYIMSDGFIIDKVIPTGTIYINDDLKYNSYHTPKIKEYWNSNVELYIGTGYKLSEIEEVSYYIASRELSQSALEAVTWNVITKDEENGYITNLELTTDRNVIIYVRIIDTASNIGYINTDMLKLVSLEAVAPIAFLINDKVTAANDPVITKDAKIKHKFGDRIKIKIVPLSDNVKEIYYYMADDAIHHSASDPTQSKTTLIEDIANLPTVDWIRFGGKGFEEIEDIIDSNISAVYAKVIDNDDNITYFMSDGYMIVKTNPEGILYINGVKFHEEFHTPVHYTSIITDTISGEITVDSTNDNIEISEVDYYISSIELDKYTDLPTITDWNKCTKTSDDNLYSFVIDTDKNTANEHIIYIKIIAETGLIGYINSSWLRYEEGLTEADVSPVRLRIDDREYNTHHMYNDRPITVGRLHECGFAMQSADDDIYDTYLYMVDKCDSDDTKFKSIEDLQAIPDDEWIQVKANNYLEYTSNFGEYVVSVLYGKIVNKITNEIFYVNSEIYTIETKIGLAIRDGHAYTPYYVESFNEFIPKSQTGTIYYHTNTAYNGILLGAFNILKYEYLIKSYDEAFETIEELSNATGWTEGTTFECNYDKAIIYAKFTYEVDGSTIYTFRQSDIVERLYTSLEGLTVKYMPYISSDNNIGFEQYELETYNTSVSMSDFSYNLHYIQNPSFMLNLYNDIKRKDVIIENIQYTAFEYNEEAQLANVMDNRKEWNIIDYSDKKDFPSSTTLEFELSEGISTAILVYYYGKYINLDGVDMNNPTVYANYWIANVVTDFFCYDPNYVPKVELILRSTEILSPEFIGDEISYIFTGFDENNTVIVTGGDVYLEGLIYQNEEDIDIYGVIEYYISETELTQEELKSITTWNKTANTITAPDIEKTFYVYAKAQDRFHNIAYANLYITISKGEELTEDGE